MSERERWIVYPLLFLALGAALRDKLIDRTTTRSIVCQELLVMEDQPLGRDPVLIARIGPGPESNGNGPPSGRLTVAGQIEVLDRGPSNNQSARSLITLGRAEFGQDRRIGGHVRVDGELIVNGPINAAFYAYQGHAIVPVLRGVLPGASLPAEMLQALPGALAPNGSANSSETAPPANSPTEQPTQQSPPATAPTVQPPTNPPASPETTKQ